jgi:hypothetical protein
MKPVSFFDLPDVLQESFLWDMELEYCPYEGSKADTIHSILYNPPSSANEYAIKNYWKALSEESFQMRAKNIKEGLEFELSAVSRLIS